MVSALVFSSLVALSQQKLEVKLVDLDPVTAFGTKFSQKNALSIGGVVVPNGIGSLPNTGDGTKAYATYVFSVPEKATAFRSVYGIPDGEKSKGTEGILSVYIDGELIKEYRAEAEQKPVKIEMTLNKAASMKLVFEGGGALGNPVFSTLGATAPKTTPDTQPKPKEKEPAKTDTTSVKSTTDVVRVVMTMPEGSETYVNKALFKWEKIDGATAYGIEFIMMRNDDSSATPTRLLRAFTTKGESFEWNFSDDVLSGEYQVSVIAFNKKGVLTRFSAPKRFKIARK
jgi:hypothetical protein